MEPPNHFQMSAVCHGTLKPPSQEAQSSLVFLAHSHAYGVRCVLAFPAFVDDQSTLYIGAGGIGAINNISVYY